MGKAKQYESSELDRVTLILQGDALNYEDGPH